MTIRRGFFVCAVICAIALAFSAVIGPSLPDIVATHWNAKGQIDGRGPKATALYLMPAIMVLNLFLFLALPRLSPKKFELENSGQAYASVYVVIQAMFLCLHVIFLQGARNEAIDISRWLMPVMFIFFALMGNWMGKIRQNFFMGVRTPWTLADARVWDATHRATAKIWFFGGVVGALVCALGAPWWIGMIGFLIMAFYPIYLSWAIYRRLSP